jgi:hypothetical protein
MPNLDLFLTSQKVALHLFTGESSSALWFFMLAKISKKRLK